VSRLSAAHRYLLLFRKPAKPVLGELETPERENQPEDFLSERRKTF
jgi:hypothetical protein